MEQEISITGEPAVSPETCLFRVDRPVYPGGAAFFGNREAAGLSPLARRIFGIAEVESVLIAGERVTVTKSGIDPWPVIGRQIGAKIREHIRSNDPAVSEEFERRMLGKKLHHGGNPVLRFMADNVAVQMDAVVLVQNVRLTNARRLAEARRRLAASHVRLSGTIQNAVC